MKKHPPAWAGFRWESQYAQLPAGLFTEQAPTQIRDPRLVILNEGLAAALGLDVTALASADGAAMLAGNFTIEGRAPIAQAYAGHQFGHFTMLGDGRALLLGEHRTPDGRLVDIQWKGPGRTPYSRGGDGRLALGPALREFLVSEAMAALGVPTTRSLAVVETGEPVVREEILPGAVLTRVASSHVRVGTFQFAASTGDKDLIQALVDFSIGRHYPDVTGAAQFYERVIERQASLVAHWLSVGFIHGVMNTDNMTVSGETIDYGPCAFMDVYDPATVFSSIDVRGRYAFGQQPGIAGWNLARLGEALVPLIGLDKANECLARYGEKFDEVFLRLFAAKLALTEPDAALVDELLQIAAREGMDFTSLWRGLIDDIPAPLTEWGVKWRAKRAPDWAERMRGANPVVIPRNHRVEEALARAYEGDLSSFLKLLAAVRDPFTDTPENRGLGAPPTKADPDYRTFCGT